ncbi:MULTISPECIES: MMPL/RND family transporter [Mycobacteriaceae]|jgi:RND superfamily putative drug exporter|uniref:MMPL/RND family transporter n=1 Tax=Mycobacteriaceae TaxID=1762 RepID=UPI000ACC56DD|nr:MULTISPECIES: RND family transporter [Mycobacteriaceae]MCV7275614.1 RND family transporter [Mycolicibacter arupensis]MCV7386067.1 RND family transporter [Mycolicibacter longobardus]ULP46250.1 RND family transporter [Mycolicibacter virginiensis]UVO12518.1 RND family transporter [Mycobacterium sp. SVM_VP21]
MGGGVIDGDRDFSGTTATLPKRTGGSAPAAASSEYSVRLAALAGFTVRHKALVMGAWVGVALVLALLFPQLETVVRQQSVNLLPGDVPSFQTVDRMSAAFSEQGSKTMVFVAMEDPAGLTPAVRQHYEQLVARLSANTDHVLLVEDLLADPVTAAHAVSNDHQAWYLPVGVAGTLGDPTAAASVQAVRDIAAGVFAGTSTTAYVTGPTATFSDMIASAEHDLLLISIATAGLIALILLIVYRSVFTALLPLLVIAVSLAVGRGVLSVLGELGMPVSQFTVAFMTAILLGAGTDYTVFLISRYHEQRRTHVPADQAVIHATASIGRVILASAATVAFAFLAMVFARLSVFAALGPSCAVAVLIGFAATVTLLPPVLALASKHGIGEPKSDRTRRYWNSVAVAVVRRPGRLLITSLVILLPLAGVAATMKISYDDRKGQPASTASNQGYQLLDHHFGKDIVIPEFLVVESPTDMRTGKGLADLDEMASRISQIPGVTKVSGITRPTGERLEQARLSWQNGQIGDKLAGAVADGNERKDDLTKLTDGADQLASGLAQLDTTLRRALTPLTGILAQAQSAGAQAQQFRPLLQQLSATAPAIDHAIQSGPGLRPLAEQAQSAITILDPLAAALNTSPWCLTTPQCAQIRDQVQILVSLRDSGFFTEVADLGDHYNPTSNATVAGALTDVQNAVTGLDKAFGALGDPTDLAGNIGRLQDGISRLASGAQALATGVHTLADSNIELLSGMSQIATQLQNSARASASSDSASGFYLPANVFENRRFADVAKQFLSADGKAARFAIESTPDPYSGAAIRLAHEIVDVANAARPNTSLADVTVSVAGFPAVNSDIQRLLRADFAQLAIATLLIVGLILVVLLRAVLAPLYLLGTVVLNYLASLGIGVLIFQWGLNYEIAWPVPLLAFIILVAVGADYNMLLVSRLREESGPNIRVGVLRTVANTGSVITSAGLIFAASMFGLTTGSIAIMIQAGLIIGCGLLLDTFLVRTLTVPAIATLLREASWWPNVRHRHRGRRTRQVADRRSTSESARHGQDGQGVPGSGERG